MGHRLGATLKVLVVEPVQLHPGEDTVLVELENFSTTSAFKIVCLGVTQHPDTLYGYNSDGVGVSVPVPLGTFYNPIYPCKDMGGGFDVTEKFLITVKNDGVEAHKYAAIVWYETTRSG